MKNCLLWILLALMSFTSYSQDLSLRPDSVIITGNGTLFCWGQPKAKAIAKKIIRLSYCDSISTNQAEEIFILDSMITDQGTIIKSLEEQKRNMLQISDLKDKEIVNLDIIINKKDREIKKQKRLKWVGIVAGGVLSLFLIVK